MRLSRCPAGRLGRGQNRRRPATAWAGATPFSGGLQDPAALERLLETPGDLVLNCGYGTGHSVLEVLDAVDRVTNMKLVREVGPRRLGDSGALVADNRAILATLDWTPQRADLDVIGGDALAWERKLGERQG